MYRQIVRGILRLRGDVTSREVFFVDMTVVSFYLQELFVKFACFKPCKLFLLLIPPCIPVLPTCLDYGLFPNFDVRILCLPFLKDVPV